VWADLSGLWIGDAQAFNRDYKSGALDRQIDRLRQWIEYTEKPDRFLYGSDWPLATMLVYRDFVKRMFPQAEHQRVFRDNARDLSSFDRQRPEDIRNR